MRAKKLTTYALLIALALVLSYLESLVPLPVAVPGLKLGLPNAVVLFALYRLGEKDAAFISLLRVLLAAVFLGTLFSLAYSAAGAVLSLLVMCLLRRSGRFGCTGVSVAGAVVHNLAQVLVAALLLETAGLLWYFPALLFTGTVAGVCVGALSALLLRRITKEK